MSSEYRLSQGDFAHLAFRAQCNIIYVIKGHCNYFTSLNFKKIIIFKLLVKSQNIKKNVRVIISKIIIIQSTTLGKIYGHLRKLEIDK